MHWNIDWRLPVAENTLEILGGFAGGFRTVETGVRDYVEWLKAQRSS